MPPRVCWAWATRVKARRIPNSETKRKTDSLTLPIISCGLLSFPKNTCPRFHSPAVLDTMGFCQAMLVASLRIACGRPRKRLKKSIPLFGGTETHSLTRANHFFCFGGNGVRRGAGMQRNIRHDGPGFYWRGTFAKGSDFIDAVISTGSWEKHPRR